MTTRFPREHLTVYIALNQNLNLLKSHTDSIVAHSEIANLGQKIDFLFTHVEMPGLFGIELCKKIRNKVNCLVLVSGHLHYALDGYDVHAQQFLTKPCK